MAATTEEVWPVQRLASRSYNFPISASQEAAIIDVTYITCQKLKFLYM
jgi:hypothetical protein